MTEEILDKLYYYKEVEATPGPIHKINRKNDYSNNAKLNIFDVNSDVLKLNNNNNKSIPKYDKHLENLNSISKLDDEQKKAIDTEENWCRNNNLMYSDIIEADKELSRFNSIKSTNEPTTNSSSDDSTDEPTTNDNSNNSNNNSTDESTTDSNSNIGFCGMFSCFVCLSLGIVAGALLGSR